MNVIDKLQEVIAFLTGIFDGFGAWFKKVTDFFTYLSTQRMFLVASVIASVKAVYDFSVAAFNSAADSMADANVGEAVTFAGAQLSDLFAFGNAIVPISESIAMFAVVVEFWIACTLVKIILCMIPTIK